MGGGDGGDGLDVAAHRAFAAQLTGGARHVGGGLHFLAGETGHLDTQIGGDGLGGGLPGVPADRARPTRWRLSLDPWMGR
ncbi:hypothetical protein LAUMK4_04079 [Mycobacterium persicum]|uniref:Uncharacterized protein n=1 Tax=Mycobacterium persicum TaxID=1487726 RepID=A0ABY6RML0_9MYCO|nr:hypothetical protein [Mycobacterium persicum]VAZ98055.1 hypothetical protein LAUMK4_04079 [Mycobacterium persicum]